MTGLSQRSIAKATRFVLLLAVCLRLGSAIVTHSQADVAAPEAALEIAATDEANASNALVISFDGVYSLALEFRAPTFAALDANRHLLAELHYTVSAYRDIPGWAKVTLVPTRYVDSGWANVETLPPLALEVVLHEVSRGQWGGYLAGSPQFVGIADLVPPEFIDLVSPLPPLEGAYKFPWQSGQSWWAVQGWHDGSAIDFQPAFDARFAVLAAESGRLRELCSDGYQSLLEIQHADGQSTFYLHVTLSLNVRRLLDHNVRRGQYLGELIGRDQFRTPCGIGRSRHLHFAVTDRRMFFEDYPIAGIADTASCCANPPLYRSTNERVDNSRAG